MIKKGMTDVVYDKHETIQLLKMKFDLYSSVIDIAWDKRKIQMHIYIENNSHWQLHILLQLPSLKAFL